MEKFLITGEKKLSGNVSVSGSKNVALKTLVAACLTNQEVRIENIPYISDFFVMADIIKELGGDINVKNHAAVVHMKNFAKSEISLDTAAEIRTSSMFLAPMLARLGKASIPNPGGCRIGKRPIDRTIDGLKKMGAHIYYDSNDGYFHAGVSGENGNRLHGTTYAFEKSTHTGTETMILAAVLARGKTVLMNAAHEPEIDELIELLTKMGAEIKRTNPRTVEINGVQDLHGATFAIGPDRNEIVTFAVAAIITDGDIFVKNTNASLLSDFLTQLEKIGAGFESQKNGIRFFSKGIIKPSNIITSPYPGFMTDWQGPWAVLMTKANGVSTIHETVYESRFGYVDGLKKMGAKIALYNPIVSNAKLFYNFNLHDDLPGNYHAIRIFGPSVLHNGVVTITDLRAGATLVLGALAAKGKSAVFGVEHLDRGYEKFEQRLKTLGADIQRVSAD